MFVGAYHFARPELILAELAGIPDPVPDAIAEADHFIDTATPQSGELIPVLDLEDYGKTATDPGLSLGPAALGPGVPRAGLRADGCPGRDLRLAQLLVHSHGQLPTGSPTTATRPSGSPTGPRLPAPPSRRATGAGSAGRSGSTRPAARSPGSAGASTWTSTGAPTSRPSSSRRPRRAGRAGAGRSPHPDLRRRGDRRPWATP